MARASLQLYPSGFYGAQASVPMVAAAQRDPDEPPINGLVESLYDQLISKERALDNFEFRKQLYIAALAAFGTTRFDEWYLRQQHSVVTGELHKDFLVDTLRFIETGERSMPAQSWGTLLSFNGDRPQPQTVMDQYARNFFGITGDGVNRTPRNGLLVDVLVQWLGQPGGAADLLTTLHVLFGAQASPRPPRVIDLED